MSDDIYDILNDKLLNTTYSFYNRDSDLKDNNDWLSSL